MVRLGVFIIKHVAGIGIHPVQPNESIYNRRNIGVLLIFAQTFFPVTAFLVFSVTAKREFAECFFIWVSLLGALSGTFVTILKTRSIFDVLDYANNFIDKRK